MNNNTNYSNYEDLGLRDAQLIMASILKDVKKICDKHNIRYFLDAGTLIGAVRHKGFIPWDDDIDIGMLREDYNEFLSVVKNELLIIYFCRLMKMILIMISIKFHAK